MGCLGVPCLTCINASGLRWRKLDSDTLHTMPKPIPKSVLVLVALPQELDADLLQGSATVCYTGVGKVNAAYAT